MRAFAGTGALLRLALRRDRILLPAWMLAFILIVQGSASAFAKLYGDAAERAGLAASAGSNPTFRALYGPIPGDSTGALFGWRYGATLVVAAAVLSLLIVVRHTRGEEESGRLELVSSGVVGRLAPLTSSLLLVYAMNIVLGLAFGGIVSGAGYEASGAFAYGFMVAAGGILFGTLAGLTAQVTESARFANGLAAIVLGVAYMLRALGDSAGDGGPTWLSWVSPLGWAGQVRPFAGDRWWVFGLFAAAVVALGGIAYRLNLRRDFGAGLIRPRPGRADAKPGLRSPLALAWRLQRGLFYGWLAAFVFLGLVFGGVANGIDELFKDQPQLVEVLQRLNQGSVFDIYMTMIMGIIALIVSVYAIQATLRLRSEETNLLAEPVLATGVGRVRWAASHFVFALVGPAVLLLVSGLVMGVTYGAAVGDVGGQIGSAVRSSIVQLPAVWVLSGLALALFGLLPRLVIGAWVALVVFVLLGQIGPILQLDQWAMDVSPFSHVPAANGSTFDVVPVIWLVLVSAALAAVGFAAFRRRDLATAG